MKSCPAIVLSDSDRRWQAHGASTHPPAVAPSEGLGALPTDHDPLLGTLGMHGTRAANLAVQECDLLVCVGARFDDRATGKLDGFAPHARVVHLDADPAELGKLRPTDVRGCVSYRIVWNRCYSLCLQLSSSLSLHRLR